MTLTCLVAMAKPYKENYKFHNTTDTVLMLLLTMFYGLLVFGSIVNMTVGSYYFKGTTSVLRLVTAGLPMYKLPLWYCDGYVQKGCVGKAIKENMSKIH